MINKIDNIIVNGLNDKNICIPDPAPELMREAGRELDSNTLVQFEKYSALIQEWNGYASLMSKKDAEQNIGLHLADSLSLTTVIDSLELSQGLLLDIGAGGGFPAVPLAIAASTLRVVMVEKASKKVAFLRKAVATLHLESVEVMEGIFPEAIGDLKPDLITARAVETPEKILPDILRIVESGAVFLCQAPENRINIPKMFHVEHIQDKWTDSKLRRGNLYIIRA